MITVKELFENDCDSIVRNLVEYWGIHRDSKGNKFIICELPPLDDFLEEFNSLIDDPYDDLVDESWSGADDFANDCRDRINITYMSVLKLREAFEEEMEVL